MPSSLLVIYHLMPQAPSGILLIVAKSELVLTMIPLVHRWNGLVVCLLYTFLQRDVEGKRVPLSSSLCWFESGYLPQRNL